MEDVTDTQQDLPGNVKHSVQLCLVPLSWCTHLLVFLLWNRMRSQVLLRRVPVVVWMPGEVVALCLDALGHGGALEKQCWEMSLRSLGHIPWVMIPAWLLSSLVLCLEGVSPPAPGVWESSHVPLRSAGLGVHQHRGFVALMRQEWHCPSPSQLPGVPSCTLHPKYHTWHQGTHTFMWEITKDGQELHHS